MPDIHGLIDDFLLLAYHIMVYISVIIMFACFLLLGLWVIALVIALPVCVIIDINECVKEHRNRTDVGENGDCENGHQDLIESDGQHITEEVKESSFDEDARTIVGEESGNNSVDLNEKANFEEHYPLLKDDGQHTIKEDRVSFDEDARTVVGEESGKSSVDLNEKANSEEHYPLLKDDGQHTIKEDRASFDENARTIVGDENGKSSVDLTQKLYLEGSYPLLKDDGQHSIQEDKVSSDGHGRKSLEEDNDKGSIGLNDKGYFEER